MIRRHLRRALDACSKQSQYAMAGASPAMALYAASAGCRDDTSDNSRSRLIAKSIDRRGNVASHWPAFPGSAFLG